MAQNKISLTAAQLFDLINAALPGTLRLTYGSRALNMFRPDSDYDIALCCQNITVARAIREVLIRTLDQNNVLYQARAASDIEHFPLFSIPTEATKGSLATPEVNLALLPSPWFHTMDYEYARAKSVLECPSVKREYLRHLEAGDKRAAYRSVGITVGRASHAAVALGWRLLGLEEKDFPLFQGRKLNFRWQRQTPTLWPILDTEVGDLDFMWDEKLSPNMEE